MRKTRPAATQMTPETDRSRSQTPVTTRNAIDARNSSTFDQQHHKANEDDYEPAAHPRVLGDKQPEHEIDHAAGHHS